MRKVVLTLAAITLGCAPAAAQNADWQQNPLPLLQGEWEYWGVEDNASWGGYAKIRITDRTVVLLDALHPAYAGSPWTKAPAGATIMTIESWKTDSTTGDNQVIVEGTCYDYSNSNGRPGHCWHVLNKYSEASRNRQGKPTAWSFSIFERLRDGTTGQAGFKPVSTAADRGPKTGYSYCFDYVGPDDDQILYITGVMPGYVYGTIDGPASDSEYSGFYKWFSVRERFSKAMKDSIGVEAHVATSDCKTFRTQELTTERRNRMIERERGRRKVVEVQWSLEGGAVTLGATSGLARALPREPVTSVIITGSSGSDTPAASPSRADDGASAEASAAAEAAWAAEEASRLAAADARMKAHEEATRALHDQVMSKAKAERTRFEQDLARAQAEEEKFAEDRAQHAIEVAAADVERARYEAELALYRRDQAAAEAAERKRQEAERRRQEAEQKRRALDLPVEWQEGVVVCDSNTPQHQFGNWRCTGPLQMTYAKLGTPQAEVGLRQACGVDSGIREIGSAGGYRLFGCGFGIHPNATMRDAPMHADPAGALGLGGIAGRQSYRCPIKQTNICRTR